MFDLPVFIVTVIALSFFSIKNRAAEKISGLRGRAEHMRLKLQTEENMQKWYREDVQETADRFAADEWCIHESVQKTPLGNVITYESDVEYGKKLLPAYSQLRRILSEQFPPQPNRKYGARPVYKERREYLIRDLTLILLFSSNGCLSKSWIEQRRAFAFFAKEPENLEAILYVMQIADRRMQEVGLSPMWFLETDNPLYARYEEGARLVRVSEISKASGGAYFWETVNPPAGFPASGMFKKE